MLKIKYAGLTVGVKQTIENTKNTDETGVFVT